MESNEEVLRAKIADLEKENKQLWEREFEREGPVVAVVATDSPLAASPEAERGPRIVSCPGCGAQNSVDGRCAHCGVAHEVYQK